MKFASTNTKASPGAVKESRMKRRQFGRGESASEATTVFRVLPQAMANLPQITKVKNWDRKRAPTGDSPSSPQPMMPMMDSTVDEEGLQHPGTLVKEFQNLGTVDEPAELHADFLGVGNDGTIFWAEEPDEPRSQGEREPVRPLSEVPSSLDVPITLDVKPRRPKIQLTIPQSRQPPSIVRQQPEQDQPMEPRQPASPAVSIRSSRVSSNTSTIRQSFVSHTIIDVPEPTIPISSPSAPSHGLGFGQQGPRPEMSASSLSASSDEHLDDDASSTYSGRSSVSSATMDMVYKPSMSRTGSVAYSILSPATAGVYDEPLQPPKYLRPMKSAISLAELSNKPLPPEPLDMAPAPLSVAGRYGLFPPVQSGSPKSTRSCSPPSDTSSSFRTPPRMTSRTSLKSKYSSNDLDAIDQAFQRSSPSTEMATLMEAEVALELQLSTISEDAAPEELPFDWDDLPKVNGPLQIARGPMAMAPSRAPPPRPPPGVQHDKPTKMERSGARNPKHVATQLRSPMRVHPKVQDPRSEPRQDSYRSKWSSKAHKVISRYQVGNEIRGGALESPTTSLRSLPTTPISGGAPTTGFLPSPDPAVLEINKRLELLKMKERSEAFRMEALRLADERDEFRVPLRNVAMESLRTSHNRAPSVILPSRRGSEANVPADTSSVPSVVSLTISDLTQSYANMPSSSVDVAEMDTAAKAEQDRNISAEAAEAVLLRILQSLTSLQDLFSAAVVSKGFYRTYKRNELPLMQNALKAMSPAAWELREMSPPFADGNDLDRDRPVPEYTPQTYLRYYTRDMYIMVALKSLILVRCESFLRPETVSALGGNDNQRSLQLDDAFWRVWTFCKIFGNNKNRENDIVGQMDWLRGGVIAHQSTCSSTLASTDPGLGMSSALLNPPESFGLGNGRGLTPNELWDMTEIWTCLGVLIQGFQGKRDLARAYNIFEGQNVTEGDVAKEDSVLGKFGSDGMLRID